ncbi:MAG: virulence RhuM family protein [Gelidibacter sp.]|nr:virulence RhuM family protein [Gelidibacter sp.]
MDKYTTVAKFITVQNEENREVTREVEHDNLDVIISLGYRAMSKRGTQFKFWNLLWLRTSKILVE